MSKLVRGEKTDIKGITARFKDCKDVADK